MIEIKKVYKQQILTIRKLAQAFWPEAFKSVLSEQQIAYMMEMMYSTTALEKQMNQGHQFALVSNNNELVGYLSYEINCNNTNKTKIHKLYISPNHQRVGIGKAMIIFVAKQALQNKNNFLFLNVNKHNSKAISFYNKQNFKLVKKEEIDIGHGFIMDDYVFELALKEQEQ